MGNVKFNPLDLMGAQDPHANWAGWLYATDADTGEWKWRLKTNYPIVSGVTPTGGGIVCFGNAGGNFYAVGRWAPATVNYCGTRSWKARLAVE
jgi:alcohol dehydrogenase (cytochrome c)